MKNISTAKPPSLGYLRQFLGGRYDVVWVHGYATVNSLHALLAARLTGAKTLLRTDSTLLDRERSAGKLAVRRVFFAGLRPLVDGVLPVGTRNSEYWRGVLGARVPQWTMPYAVDNEYFAARARSAAGSREELRAELGLATGRPVFLFAAKLVARKRCADLLEAYALLRRAGSESLPYILLVGDGAERVALERRAKEIDADGIRFAGFRSQAEMPRFYDLCDAFVLPSVHEPWGLAVNEAMASGRAVVVSDEVGCQPDLVRDAETGLVFRARDAQSLADCLRRLLDAGLRERLAAAGRAHVAGWDFEADVRALRRAVKEVRE
jgi:glycosyltransferase involved in cell wall biosynthesis